MYNETAYDPKLRRIAHCAGTTVPNVVAVWVSMLCHASGNEGQRWGTLAGWQDDECAFHLGMDRAVVFAIRTEMEGRLLDGERVIAWDKRQFTSDDSAARKRRSRNKAREDIQENQSSNPDVTGQSRNRDVTGTGQRRDGHTPDTDTETDTDKDTSLRSVSPSPSPGGPARGERKARAVPKGQDGRDYSPEFLALWELFPRKVNKPDAWKAYRQALKRGATHAALVECLDIATKAEWQRRDIEHIPHPATWLRSDPWDVAGADPDLFTLGAAQ